MMKYGIIVGFVCLFILTVEAGPMCRNKEHDHPPVYPGEDLGQGAMFDRRWQWRPPCLELGRVCGNTEMRCCPGIACRRNIFESVYTCTVTI